MADRPILFSGPMVRALLDGRKTQTRRAIKAPTARGGFILSFNHGIPEFNFGPDDRKPNGDLRWHSCPYGQPGDLLWVRETFSQHPQFADLAYKADDDGDGFEDSDGFLWEPKYSPSIHMPRALSRLTLRITDVRVQRLQECSNEDAVAEGIGTPTDMRYATVDGYRPLWESINGAGSWDANPWVWALTFEVIKANVDSVEVPRG